MEDGALVKGLVERSRSGLGTSVMRRTSCPAVIARTVWENSDNEESDAQMTRSKETVPKGEKRADPQEGSRRS